MELVSLEQIKVARQVLAGVVRQTPMEHSRVLEQRFGGPVYLKCENLQRGGSFKIRGAYLRIHGLSGVERARGVVAASAGNHAQGVALAAQMLGTAATVYMPRGASLPKVTATRGYGATVHLVGDALQDALAEATAFAEQTGAVFIHPFDHPDVVAGQGTVGLEILDQLPEAGTILAGCGGGGLVSGIAAAVKAVRPEIQVVGVQAEQAAAWPGSLAAGRPVRLPFMNTMADGIAVGQPGEVTYAHVAKLVDDMITVDEESLSRALLLCLERAKLVVEPAGAAAVAAVLDNPGRFEPPVCAVLSGGNVDPLLLLHVIQHGMAAAGRYLSLRITLPDRPGSLAALLSTVGQLGANVVDVAHSRLDRVALGEVTVALSLETRGPDHCEQVVQSLRAAAYTVA
jgi:threonine dehydratase